MTLRLGIDISGTFTDFAPFDERGIAAMIVARSGVESLLPYSVMGG